MIEEREESLRLLVDLRLDAEVAEELADRALVRRGGDHLLWLEGDDAKLLHVEGRERNGGAVVEGDKVARGEEGKRGGVDGVLRPTVRGGSEVGAKLLAGLRRTEVLQHGGHHLVLEEVALVTDGLEGVGVALAGLGGDLVPMGVVGLHKLREEPICGLLRGGLHEGEEGVGGAGRCGHLGAPSEHDPGVVEHFTDEVLDAEIGAGVARLHGLPRLLALGGVAPREHGRRIEHGLGSVALGQRAAELVLAAPGQKDGDHGGVDAEGEGALVEDGPRGAPLVAKPERDRSAVGLGGGVCKAELAAALDVASPLGDLELLERSARVLLEKLRPHLLEPGGVGEEGDGLFAEALGPEGALAGLPAVLLVDDHQVADGLHLGEGCVDGGPEGAAALGEIGDQKVGELGRRSAEAEVGALFPRQP